jgi:hypothetical protein
MSVYSIYRRTLNDTYFRDIMDTSESWSLLQTMSFHVWIAAMEEERLAYLPIPCLETQALSKSPISLLMTNLPT